MKVLIVDDSKAMRMIVRRALRQAGYDNLEVFEASNGAEGLAAVQQNQPALVLCDWNMPEMSGLELLAALRNGNAAVKFGFVTSESTPVMRSRALEAGALFLISKPFTAEAFQEALQPILG